VARVGETRAITRIATGQKSCFFILLPPCGGDMVVELGSVNEKGG